MPRSRAAQGRVPPRDKTKKRSSGPTPMMEQYGRMKAAYPDCILMFRMGDFFEMFYEDAEIAARELGLTLTSREKGDAERIPLAGVPWQTLDGYLVRLVRRGHHVAICDQVEDASQAKGLVKREVVRVVSPGTLLEENGLDGARNNFLVAVGGEGRRVRSANGASDERIGWARLDLSTGEFEVGELPPERVLASLDSSEVAEVLWPRGWAERDPGARWRRELNGKAFTDLEEGAFLPDVARRLLTEHFAVESLDGFGLEEMPGAVAAGGALLHYLRRTMQGSLAHVRTIRLRAEESRLEIDETALRNLEVLEPLRSGDRDATVLGVLDVTMTPMGSRQMRRWLREPLLDVGGIEARLDAVQELMGDPSRLERLREGLKGLRDLERLVGRVGCERATPRDLGGIRDFLKRLPEAVAVLGGPHSALLGELARALRPPDELPETLETALETELPLQIADGGIFRAGYDAELDRLRAAMKDGRSWIASLQKRERERTGIATLKVGFNRVFGYYLEVTRSHADQVPEDYERRQTLVGAERYVTAELKERESEILQAEERVSKLERDLFLSLRRRVAEHAGELLGIASAAARLDVLLAFALVSRERGYVRPAVDESTRLRIEGGRHPVVEGMLARQEFVANDALLDTEANQILLITGPNMAGKSTFLRQVALIVLMAQAGCFVPAARAEVGLVDRIYTRVGAGDDLARGRSTFLVEMQEAANILNNATDRSLILLDEVGRGTSTFDGLSIAWAMTEFLHDQPKRRARTLFATHYHELTELGRQKERVVNLNVAVREWNDQIIFLHEIRRGPSDQSYGIHVARLAGLPPQVIERAREVLRWLEEGEIVREAIAPPAPETRETGVAASGPRPREKPRQGQLDLFGGAGAALAAEIAALDVEGMTPLEALNRLAAIQAKLKERLEG